MYRSWMIYSVAVYLGLLLAGSLIGPSPTPTIGADREQRIETSVIESHRDPAWDRVGVAERLTGDPVSPEDARRLR